MWQLNEYAETSIAQRLSMINGVAQVNVFGGQKYAVRVQVDPTLLTGYQLGINEIQDSLREWNVNLPTGTLNGRDQAFNIQASGQLSNAAAYRSAVVAYRNGSPVRLEQVANVIDGVEDDKAGSWFYNAEGGRPAINLLVMRQPSSNVIELTDAIKKLLPEIQAALPPSVKLEIRGDRSQTIRESFHDVQLTLSLALGLVIMVIFLFLRKGSATLIPGTALPFSIVGNLRGDVRPGVHPQQYFHDGADPVGGVCGGRCHRHAGKRRPAHRTRRVTPAGRLRRVKGNRFHDRFDDAFPRRCIHSSLVYGRDSRTPLPGVRGHDLRRHLHLRHRFHHPHTSPLQPPPSREGRKARAFLPHYRAFS